jgi:hypothetical protein
MKKLLTTVIVLLVAANAHAGSLQDRLAGLVGIETVTQESIASEANFTAWLLGTPTELDNPDAEISARLGWLNDDLEFGAQFDSIGIHGDDNEAFGVYAIMHIATDGILGTSYIGYAAGIDKNRYYGPVAGSILKGVVVEYRYRDFDEESPLGNATDRHQVYVGVQLRF